MKAEDLKLIVKEKYGEIAKQTNQQSSCCGTSSCCSGVDYTVFSESYENQKGYNPEADLNPESIYKEYFERLGQDFPADRIFVYQED